MKTVAIAMLMATALLLVWKRHKSHSRVVRTRPSSDCLYSLDHFDFHYKKEPDSPSIVMLGNSQIRHADWGGLLGRDDVVNRGISGDRLRCMRSRLAYLPSTARVIVVEGGINDLQQYLPSDTVLHHYQEIVTEIVKMGKVPIVNAVIRISPEAGYHFTRLKECETINISIDSINVGLLRFTQAGGYSYIDMNKQLSKRGILQSEYTSDGVHLNNAAYRLWATAVKTEIEKILLPAPE